MVFVVGTINVKGSAVGFRLFNLDKQETEDISKAALYQGVASGKRKIENVVVDKKARNFKIINSMPLGVINKESLNANVEEITNSVGVILAEVVEDDTEEVMGYLVSTNDPAFAVYRTQELVAMFDDLNICYKGASVVDGELRMKTESPLPILKYSDVSEFMEDADVDESDIEDDIPIETDNNEVLLSDMDMETDTIDELLEDIGDEMLVSEDDDDIVAGSDVDDMDDIVDEMTSGETDDADDIVDMDGADAVDGSDEDVEDVADNVEIQRAVADFGAENVATEFEAIPDSLQADSIDSETIESALDDMLLETTDNENDVDDAGVGDIANEQAIADEQPNTSDNDGNEQADTAEIVQEAAELSLSISDEYDNAEDMWKFTVNVDGERTTVAIPVNDPSVSVWLKIPGISITETGISRAVTKDALVDSNELVAVVVPKAIRSLGAYTFAYCTALESVTFMTNDDLAIPEGCFAGCTALQNVTVNNNVVSVGDYAFVDCVAFDGANLIKYEVITEIGAYAFANTAISSVEFNSALKSVGMAAFINCSKLQKAFLTRTIVYQWATVEKRVDKDMLNDIEIRRKYCLDVFAACERLSVLNLKNTDIVRMIPYYLQGTALAQAV